MAGQLHGKRCLIVGGTSGIGLAAAERFLAEDAQVVVCGRSADELPAAEARLGCLCLTADVTHETKVDELLALSTQALGGLDVLFHVAGGSGRKYGDGPLHESSLSGWHATVNLNLTSTYLTNRAAVRHFLDRHQPGAVLNTASVLATDPEPGHFDTCAYSAAKGGVLALSRTAAARYAANRIRVNVLLPGLVDTPASARAVGDPDIAGFLRGKQPLADGPLLPGDVAGAAVFLCSDGAKLVTGAALPVDGGWGVC